ncbi:MAG: hypothetical protein Q4D31_06820 [Eubacteriales bacterium]|nr:hypothetical protein [Eubacteriales bacterium]
MKRTKRNWTKGLPIGAVVLCVPGIGLRALHLLNGFDLGTGLPTVGDPWVWYFIALLLAAGVVFAAQAAPLWRSWDVPFEQLMGTRSTGFRMGAVVAGLLLLLGGVGYAYLALTTAEQDTAGWARALELFYSVMTVLSGVCMIVLAGAQGKEMDERSAMCTLVPLLWSCVHLLVNYRMTCTDPKLVSFAFGLVADMLLVLAFYHLARLLYGRPRPAALAFCSAAAVLTAVSDAGGYGLAYLMGVHTLDWSAKMVLRGGLSVAACVMLLTELAVLCGHAVVKGQHEI